MLNVPAEIQALFKADGIRKNFRVHFPNGEHTDLTNADIIQESVTFTESVCSRNTFQFGLSERSEIEFECVGVPNIYGMMIECGIEIDTSSLSAAQITVIQADPGDGTLVLAADSDIGFGFYRVPYGVFIVESCPRSHGAMQRRKVTGYSQKPSDITIDLHLMDYELPFKSYLASQTVIYGATDPTMAGFTKTTVAGSSIGVLSPAPYLYDSAGKKYNFQFSGSISSPKRPTGYAISEYTSADPEYDFGRITFTYSEDNYTLGSQMVAAVNAAGYNLTYNANKKKIFNDNEEALKAVYPFYFHPCIVLNYRSDSTNTKQEYLPFSIPVTSGEIFPIFRHGNNGLVPNDSWNYSYYLMLPPQEGNPTIYLYKEDAPDHTFTLTYGDPGISITSLELFTQDAADPVNLTVNSTLTIAKGYPNVRGKTFQDGYTYSNAFSMSEAIDGILEVQARFGVTDRFGDFDAINLDPSSPVSISASDYSELWWDDYSIDGIGTITFAFNKGDTIVQYDFGQDDSVYDMTDNGFLKYMIPTDAVSADTIAAAIITELDADFIPHAPDVNFTPTDLEMRGLPYLEAGDYLSIDDASGGTVETYILRRELSGIQTLADTISSVGGEIVRRS